MHLGENCDKIKKKGTGKGCFPHSPIDLKIRKDTNIMAKMITKDMIITDVLQVDIETAQFFFEIGMHCLGCPSARGETVEQACMVHGVDCDELINKINTFLAEKEQA